MNVVLKYKQQIMADVYCSVFLFYVSDEHYNLSFCKNRKTVTAGSFVKFVILIVFYHFVSSGNKCKLHI